MVRITVDEDFESRLAGADEPIEICGPNGRLLGRFLPAGRVPHMKPEDQCPYTDDELREICEQPFEGRPLAKIWKDLGRT